MSVASDADLEPRPLPSTGSYPASTVLRTSPPPQAARPVPHGRPVEGHAPSPHGLPVLRWISVYRHAVVITPVARWVGSLVGRPIPTVSLYPAAAAFPITSARSATTLDFSRPAQRSLAITACRLAESPIATRLSRRLRRFRFLPARSDSYRLERPSCRVGIAPTEDQHLGTAHTSASPFPVLAASPCPVVSGSAYRFPALSVCRCLS